MKKNGKIMPGENVLPFEKILGNYIYSNIGDIDVTYYLNKTIKQDPDEYLATSDSIDRVRENLDTDDDYIADKKAFLEHQTELRSNIYDAVSKISAANKAIAKVHSLDSNSFTPTNEILGYEKEAIDDVMFNTKYLAKTPVKNLNIEKSVSDLDLSDIMPSTDNYELT